MLVFSGQRGTPRGLTLSARIFWGFIQDPAGAVGRFPLPLVGFGGGRRCLGGHAATSLPPRSRRGQQKLVQGL